jgi:hypothetical protein
MKTSQNAFLNGLIIAKNVNESIKRSKIIFNKLFVCHHASCLCFNCFTKLDSIYSQCFENGLDTLILVFITTNAVFSDYIAI